MVSNCCLRPSITPPNESIFDALDEMASIVILIASNSALRFLVNDVPSTIFPSSCLRLSIIWVPGCAFFPEAPSMVFFSLLISEPITKNESVFPETFLS